MTGVQTCALPIYQGGLFGGIETPAPRPGLTVPSRFMSLASDVACFDSDEKWPLLYRILYRLKKENRHLLAIESDTDVRRALIMRKAVKRDIHKFHAFVRFRSVEVEVKEVFTAWHEPHHWTVKAATPFFARRFGTMHLSILTPKGCAHWDLNELSFSPGVTREDAPQEDATEDFWLAY